MTSITKTNNNISDFEFKILLDKQFEQKEQTILAKMLNNANSVRDVYQNIQKMASRDPALQVLHTGMVFGVNPLATAICNYNWQFTKFVDFIKKTGKQIEEAKLFLRNNASAFTTLSDSQKIIVQFAMDYSKLDLTKAMVIDADTRKTKKSGDVSIFVNPDPRMSYSEL